MEGLIKKRVRMETLRKEVSRFLSIGFAIGFYTLKFAKYKVGADNIRPYYRVWNGLDRSVFI